MPRGLDLNGQLYPTFPVYTTVNVLEQAEWIKPGSTLSQSWQMVKLALDALVGADILLSWIRSHTPRQFVR